MRTTIALQNLSISIAHEECSSFGTPAQNILLLKSSDDNLNTLTKLDINGTDLHRVIYVHWHIGFGGEDFGVLLVEETNTLFIGAGSLSASVDLLEMKVVNQQDVMLFWSFKRVRNWVLELGEVECFLRSQSGAVLASVEVDPPYEYFETDKGIKIETNIYGTQWLHYPQQLE
jgi:hypothetical protein